MQPSQPQSAALCQCKGQRSITTSLLLMRHSVLRHHGQERHVAPIRFFWNERVRRMAVRLLRALLSVQVAILNTGILAWIGFANVVPVAPVLMVARRLCR